MIPEPTYGARYMLWLPLIALIVAAGLLVLRYWREWIPPTNKLYFSLYWLLG